MYRMFSEVCHCVNKRREKTEHRRNWEVALGRTAKEKVKERESSGEDEKTSGDDQESWEREEGDGGIVLPMDSNMFQDDMEDISGSVEV